MAGCGPTTACNLLHYINSGNPEDLPKCKADLVSFMDEIWDYVTPTLQGVSSTKLFYDGVLTYARQKGLDISCSFLDIPHQADLRPAFSNVIEFLKTALSQDVPVAFLNLCNGDEEKLYGWHWVTLISLDYEEDGSSAYVDIMDEGKIIKIDLALWYKTTKRGGGFVYFTNKA